MSGMIVAFALWFILRALDRGVIEQHACDGCFDLVHYDRKIGHFVHSNGREEAFDEPREFVNPLDDGTGPLMTHLANPV